MTRAHVRLLGPCFKTGPESTQINSVADRYRFNTKLSRFENIVNQQLITLRYGTRSALQDKSDRACNESERIQMRLDTLCIPPNSRSGNHDVCNRDTEVTEQSTISALKPTSSGSRRSTRGEVHADEHGHTTADS